MRTVQARELTVGQTFLDPVFNHPMIIRDIQTHTDGLRLVVRDRLGVTYFGPDDDVSVFS